VKLSRADLPAVVWIGARLFESGSALNDYCKTTNTAIGGTTRFCNCFKWWKIPISLIFPTPGLYFDVGWFIPGMWGRGDMNVGTRCLKLIQGKPSLFKDTV